MGFFLSWLLQMHHAIAAHRGEIDAILGEYRVPRADLAPRRVVQNQP